MKCRLLYIVVSFLALFPSYAGISVQKAVFSSSDDVKIVAVHSPSQEFISASVNEAKIIERTFSRSQKKTESFGGFSGNLLFEDLGFSSAFLSFSSNISSSTFRVLLLPKSIQNIIFLQTFI